MSEKLLTPELENLIALATPIDEESEFEFTPRFLMVDGIPEDRRPIFKFNSLKNVDKDKAAKLYEARNSDKFYKGIDGQLAIKNKIYAFIAPYITGWENVEADFTSDKIANMSWDVVYLLFCRNCFLSGVISGDIEEQMEKNQKLLEEAKEKKAELLVTEDDVIKEGL